jgi:Family of unknown function (DUF6090)
MSKSKQIVFLRLLGEAVLIIGSVYVAIVLEGISDHRDRTADAVSALAQLRGELREDQVDLQVVMAEREDLQVRYVNLLRWFEDASTLPADSVQATLDIVAYSNRTMFPRSSAWITMVASDQLGLIDDPSLVTRLGNLYESVNERLKHNGADYDEALNDIMRNATPDIWDSLNGRLLTRDPSSMAGFQGRLRYLYLTWNTWYLEYLREYQGQLVDLILNVDTYLGSHGHSTQDQL